MIPQRFTLTFRASDLLEIYRSDFQYTLFSQPNYHNLSFIGLVLVLIPVSLVAGTYSEGCYFLTLIFLCGLGYYIIHLLSDHRKMKQKQKSITDWVKAIGGYRSHQVSVHDGFIKYKRDDETFLYSLDEMATMYHTKEHFYCKLKDGFDLALPAKSFEAGEYLLFTKAVDALKE